MLSLCMLVLCMATLDHRNSKHETCPAMWMYVVGTVVVQEYGRGAACGHSQSGIESSRSPATVP